MHTISDIASEVSRGCAVNNMVENAFSYRVAYYVNENGIGRKHYADTTYGGLRKTLENIVRENLSLENSIVISSVTVRKNGKCLCLLGRAYPFCLDEYFCQITGRYKDGNKKRNTVYGRYATN